MHRENFFIILSTFRDGIVQLHLQLQVPIECIDGKPAVRWRWDGYLKRIAERRDPYIYNQAGGVQLGTQTGVEQSLLKIDTQS